MTPETLEALKGSIQKWEGVVAGTVEDQGTANCPLCFKFYEFNCDGCPVKLKTGQHFCHKTPYINYINVDNLEDGADEKC